jgi:hypothetical protein
VALSFLYRLAYRALKVIRIHRMGAVCQRRLNFDPLATAEN